MNQNEKRGVTLVELMVAATLASMVLGVAMGIWSYTRRNISRTVTRQMLQQDAMRILSQLKADLKAAKAETFKAAENPMSLEFTRYVADKDDDKKLSAEKTENVRYMFTKPILRRAVEGKPARSLSKSVENIVISRKSLSEAQKEKDSYLESRVDIALEMGSKVQGTNVEERHTQYTSVVIRDEFYTLVNKDRKEVFEIAKEVATEISKPGDSQFFNDSLDANALKSLTDEQLDDLDETQKVNLEDAKKGLKEINDRISDVDTGKKWWQGFFFGLGANEEGAEVKELREKLHDIDCPDKNIPAKGSGNRASEKVDAIAKELENKIKELDKEFMGKAFQGQTVFNLDSTDPEEKKKAEAQKRAYDMKVMDRQIEKAVAEMSEEDRKKAEENKELPTRMLDQFLRSEADIRKEIESSGVTGSQSELDELVAKEVASMKFLEEQYNNCKLDWMEDSEDENKIKAYDAAKQLKNLADSKKETMVLKEMAIDNQVEIAKARELKKESFDGS